MDLSLQSNINHIAAKPLETSQWNAFEIVNSLSVNKKPEPLASMQILTKETTWRKTAPYQQAWKTFQIGSLFLRIFVPYAKLQQFADGNSLVAG